MKKYFLVPLVITLLLASTTAFAGSNKTVKKDAIVDNLKVGLTSDNYGLKVSSAYVLGQLVSDGIINSDDASKTIIPLMKIMNDEESDEARIVAALALYQLESERGAVLFDYAARYDNSKRFSRIGAVLYRAHNERNK
ncbi:MAG TPA: hypothetical protein VKA26_03810 [Ignavibacteriaceae bacterium]|nr:hypothetical protein [Ignavibacteriaceae bacterium]